MASFLIFTPASSSQKEIITPRTSLWPELSTSPKQSGGWSSISIWMPALFANQIRFRFFISKPLFLLERLVVRGPFGFIGCAHSTRYSLARGQSRSLHGAILLQLFLRCRRKACPGDRLQPLLLNRFAGH